MVFKVSTISLWLVLAVILSKVKLVEKSHLLHRITPKNGSKGVFTRQEKDWLGEPEAM